MTSPKILVLSGSTRTGSFNTQLADVVARSIENQGGAATRISLSDYTIPLYEGDAETTGIPDDVFKLHDVFSAHDGIYLTTPEYNSFPSPLLLNALDWLSRVRHYEGGMVDAFEKPLYAISAASPSPIGGYRSLLILRQKLEIGLGATVVPAMAAIAAAYQAFDADGNLVSENDQAQVTRVVSKMLGKLTA